MVSTVEAQLISLIISVFAGLAVSLLFDLYRTINYYIKPSKPFVHVMDLLFWLAGGVVVFIILLRADFAELRVYTFIGIIVGVFVYFKLFSEYVLKFFRWIIYALLKTIRIILILVFLPFKLVYNILWAPMHHARVKAGVLFKGMWKPVISIFHKKK
jgi:spore cortex biosynthesis protein YabQ